MPQDNTDDLSTLIQAMAWCCQGQSHYLSQCWPSFMTPYGITRPQWKCVCVFFQKGSLVRGQNCACSYPGPWYSQANVKTHLPLDKMAAILQTVFSDVFSWMKSFVFWIKFHWSLFLKVQLSINLHSIAIIWTDAEPTHWSIYAALLGGDELITALFLHWWYFHVVKRTPRKKCMMCLFCQEFSPECIIGFHNWFCLW